MYDNPFKCSADWDCDSGGADIYCLFFGLMLAAHLPVINPKIRRYKQKPPLNELLASFLEDEDRFANSVTCQNLIGEKDYVQSFALALATRTVDFPSELPTDKEWLKKENVAFLQTTVNQNVKHIFELTRTLWLRPETPDHTREALRTVFDQEKITKNIDSVDKILKHLCTLQSMATSGGIACKYTHLDGAKPKRLLVNQFAYLTHVFSKLYVRSVNDLANAMGNNKDHVLHQKYKFVFYGGRWQDYFYLVPQIQNGRLRRGSLLMWKSLKLHQWEEK